MNIMLRSGRPLRFDSLNHFKCLFGSKCETPQPTKISSDMIGPSESLSNLRPIVCMQRKDEIVQEKIYREKRMEVQQFNQDFWSQHNSRFFKEREDYLKNHLTEGKQTLSADEMSIFYKNFLDKNWKAHVEYNMEWYKKNFHLLGLSIQAKISRFFKKLS